MIAIGSKAPAFRTKDEAGRAVTLADLKGRWAVVYFYPRDDTPGCTTEACEFTASIRDFEGLDAAVVGVSPDTPESHAKFIAKHELKVRLLSDPDHAMMEAYGAWGEKVLYGKKSVGVIRSTVILDPNGVVAHAWGKVKAAGHAEAVRARLAELRAVPAGKVAKARK
jgi:peroxiredoxin Q/BCP